MLETFLAFITFVSFSSQTLNGFSFLYEHVDTEFVLCLYGTRVGDSISVEGFELAEMESSTKNTVKYAPCKVGKYLGTAHNHPKYGDKDMCYQSGPDKKTFQQDTAAILDVVLCGQRKLIHIGKDKSSGIFSW